MVGFCTGIVVVVEGTVDRETGDDAVTDFVPLQADKRSKTAVSTAGATIAAELRRGDAQLLIDVHYPKHFAGVVIVTRSLS